MPIGRYANCVIETALVLLAISVPPPILAARNVCTLAADNDVTQRWHELIVTEHPAVRAARGVVIAPDGRSPMRDVLVEVYDHPEVVLTMTLPEAAKVQHRIAACITNDTGEFSLDVPSGSYEVRFSSSDPMGVECTSVLVKVRRLAFRSRVRVKMAMAT